MRIGISLLLTIIGCAHPGAPRPLGADGRRRVELRPHVISHRAGDLHVVIDGRPFSGKEWSTTYASASDARRATIHVELDAPSGPIARVDVVPFASCVKVARTLVHPAPSADEFVSESMEVYLIDPVDPDARHITTGPRIDCQTAKTGFGGTGYGPISKPVGR